MEFELEITIEAPRERVIELFDDADNLAKWQPTLKSFEHLSGEPGEPGAQSRLKYDEGGRTVELIETVLIRNLPDEFSGSYEAKGVKNWIWNYFHEAGPSRTRWVAKNKFEFGGLMVVLSLFMRGGLRKQSLEFMQNFKRFVEHGRAADA